MNKPDSVPLAGPIIHLSNQPGTYRHLAVPIRRAAEPVPYLILLRGGFTLRGDSHRSAGGLLPHHFTITRRRKRGKTGCLFLWHFPLPEITSGIPPLTSGSSALWSPDFPPVSFLIPAAAGAVSNSLIYDKKKFFQEKISKLI